MNTRTSSPALWTWMRAPSTLYSNAAGPSRSERGHDVVRGAGQHRRHRRQQPQREPRQPGRALLQRRPRDFPDVARVHRGLAHVRRRQAGGPRHRVEQDALERALPHLAHEQLDQEPPLVRPRAGEQRLDRRHPPLRRPGPALAGQGLAHPVHVEERQRIAFAGPSESAGLQRAPADPDPPLGQRPRQVQRGQLGLTPPGLPQQIGQQGDLLQLARRGPHAPDALDERTKAASRSG